MSLALLLRGALRCATLTCATALCLGTAYAQDLRPVDGVPGVQLESGYELRLAASGLTFPSNITFAEDGRAWVTESGFLPSSPPKVLALDLKGDPSSNQTAILTPMMLPMGTAMGPFTDVTYYGGMLFLGHRQRGANGWAVGAISRFDPANPAGTFKTLVTNLPSVGDHSNNEIVFGADGRLYFGQGTATNSGVVGPDNRWVANAPAFAELAPVDIYFKPNGFMSRVPAPTDPEGDAVTAAYRPFGYGAETTPYLVPAVTPAAPYYGIIAGTGTVYSLDPMAADPTATMRLEAWGLRNPFGLAFAADDPTRLFVSNNGSDVRGRAGDPSDPLDPTTFIIQGNRPVANDWDEVFELRTGGEAEFFGWPEFFHDPATNQPVLASDPQFCDNPALDADDCPQTIFDANFRAGLKVEPAFSSLGPYVSTTGLEASTSEAFGYYGDVFTTESGSFSPQTGAFTFTGYKVSRVDEETGVNVDFLVNVGSTAEELFVPTKLNKPVSAVFHDDMLAVVDLGVLEPGIMLLQAGTGKVWIVRRSGTNACTADGGMIALASGSLDTTIIVDATPDPLAVEITSPADGERKGWVITDSEGKILALPAAPPFDLNGAGVGTCLIWHLAWDGELSGATVGANVDGLEGCFDLSNPITVRRVAPGSQVVTTGMVSMPNGETTRYVCPGNDGPITVELGYTTPAGQVAYAITDENYNILKVSMTNGIDLSGAGVGTCYIWAFNYTGTITAMPGESVFSTQFSTDQWLISQNAIRAIRERPEGGTVATPLGETTVYTCVDGTPDFVGFQASGQSDANSVFVITDDQNKILMFNTQGFQDFDGAGVGNCRVWHLSFTGSLTAKPGDDAAAVALSDRCFDLSDNFITVVRNSPDGGQVSGNGQAIVELSGTQRTVAFATTSMSTAAYRYFVLNPDFSIRAIVGGAYDFTGAPAGQYLVYGASYTGGLLPTVGGPLFGQRVSVGCFDLSDGAVSVMVRGGMAFTATPVTTEDIRLSLKPVSADVATADEPATVRVTDAFGRVVLEQRVASTAQLDGLLLHVGRRTSGLHFVTVQTGEHLGTEKVLLSLP